MGRIVARARESPGAAQGCLIGAFSHESMIEGWGLREVLGWRVNADALGG